MKCIFHNDLDGHCAGAIVKHKYPETEMYEMDYGGLFPWDDLRENETVYMVDFSLDLEEMQGLAENINLIWIDHHKSAVNMVEDIECESTVQQGQSGCELTWKYLFPGDPMPWAVYLLGRYDVFDLEADPLVLPFQYGMRAKYTKPDNADTVEEWKDLLDFDAADQLSAISEKGQAVLNYIDNSNRGLMEGHSFTVKLDYLRCLAVNSPFMNSRAFESHWDPLKYDAMLAFSWLRDRWKVSLYTYHDGLDVSEVAEKYGGGGHEKAAGFTCKELPFKLIPEIHMPS